MKLEAVLVPGLCSLTPTWLPANCSFLQEDWILCTYCQPVQSSLSATSLYHCLSLQRPLRLLATTSALTVHPQVAIAPLTSESGSRWRHFQLLPSSSFEFFFLLGFRSQAPGLCPLDLFTLALTVPPSSWKALFPFSKGETKFTKKRNAGTEAALQYS